MTYWEALEYYFTPNEEGEAPIERIAKQYGFDKNDIVIEEKGTKFILTNTQNQKNNVENKNMTIIDLGECETELRKVYNISGNIYILRVDKELRD